MVARPLPPKTAKTSRYPNAHLLRQVFPVLGWNAGPAGVMGDVARDDVAKPPPAFATV